MPPKSPGERTGPKPIGEPAAHPDADYDADDHHPDDRTPGSGFILPANPFGELESESLEHFIECTIYEEASTTEAAADLDEVDDGLVFANPFTDRDDNRSGRMVTGELEAQPAPEPEPEDRGARPPRRAGVKE